MRLVVPAPGLHGVQVVSDAVVYGVMVDPFGHGHFDRVAHSDQPITEAMAGRDVVLAPVHYLNAISSMAMNTTAIRTCMGLMFFIWRSL